MKKPENIAKNERNMTLIELILETAIAEAGEYKDVRLIKEDAEAILAMMKMEKQKAKPVIRKANISEDTEVGACPQCREMLMNIKTVPTKYCQYCGQEVKWD